MVSSTFIIVENELAQLMDDNMDQVGAVIEEAVRESVGRLTGSGCPPRLAEAIRHATLDGGHRLRPRLVLAVCRAVGGEPTGLAMNVAAAIELLHCASLVHDDLPAFDDASTRRGRPSVHRAHGEALAILAGDALIMAAFGELARAGARSPESAATLGTMFARASGAPAGITAGQAWESEDAVDVERYHQAKTAALFELATTAGAVAGGADPEPWRELGRRIGLTYQVADDVRDHTGSVDDLGKPVGRDEALGRPSAVRALGLERCTAMLEGAAERAIEAIPPCPGRSGMVDLVAELMAAFRR